MSNEQGLIWLRKKIQKCARLKEIKPCNSLWNKVMFYCIYRMKTLEIGRTSQETGKVRNYTKRMELSLNKDQFRGTTQFGCLK